MRKNSKKRELKRVFKEFSYRAVVACLLVTNVVPMATPAMVAYAATVETYTPYSNSSYSWVTSADGNWQYDIVDGDNTKCIVKPYSDAMKSGAVVIPDSIDGYAPVAVYKDAWTGNTAITSVTLPSTVTEIGENAFKGCTGLASINLENVHVIGANAFNGCTSLTSIEVGSLNDLHYSSFMGCSSLETVKIGDIGNYHIYNYNSDTIYTPFTNTAVKSIELGNIGKVTNDRLGSSYTNEGIFYGLSKVESIKIGDIDTIGGADAFKNCSSLVSFEAGDIVTFKSDSESVYGKYVSPFGVSNTKLKSIKLGNVGTIQQGAFNMLNGLTSFEAGNVDKIGVSAFAASYNTTATNTITTECDFTFGDIGSIGAYAFQNRSNLSDDNLTMGSVSSVATTAFDGTQISMMAVTLNVNDGSGDSSVRYVSMGLKGNQLPKATSEGKVFTGWYLDEACTQPFVDEILESKTLYAGWINEWYYMDEDGNRITTINYDEAVTIGFDEELPVGEMTYQWRFYENFNGTTYHLAIPGETERTCIPTKDKIAATGSSGIKGSIFCEVYANGYLLENSDMIEVTDEASDSTEKVISNVTITGTMEVGESLSVSITPSGATADYQWYVSDDGNTWTEISGATSNSYTLTENEEGKYIKVEVTGTGDYDGSTSEKQFDGTVAEAGGSDLDDGEEGGSGGGSGSGSGSGSGDGNDDSENGGRDSAGRIIDSKEQVYYTELNTDEVYAGKNQKVEVYVSQGQSVAVRLPFQVTADGRKGVENKGDFEIEVRANISGADTIKVVPEAELELTTVGKNPIKATVTQDQTEFSIRNDGQEALEMGKIVDGRVTVHDLSAGYWEGYYKYTISVEGDKTVDSEENTGNVEVTP